MTAADEPRVGDLVRLTIPIGDLWLRGGPFEIVGRVTMSDDLLEVAERRLDVPGRKVEILERALPPEPPIGSIVAARDRATSVRMLDGLWYRPGNVLERTWADVVADLGRDFVILRHGWLGRVVTTPTLRTQVSTVRANAVAASDHMSEDVRRLGQCMAMTCDVVAELLDRLEALENRPAPATVHPLPSADDVWRRTGGIASVTVTNEGKS